jgi:hypothetical protein
MSACSLAAPERIGVMVIVVIFYCKRKKNSPLSLAIAETQSLSPLAPSRARPYQLVYLSKVWLSATHGSVDRTSPFLSRSAGSLINSFCNFSICDRFLRGAIVASHPVGTRPDQFAHFSRRHRLMIRPCRLELISYISQLLSVTGVMFRSGFVAGPRCRFGCKIADRIFIAGSL